ncbi:MAG: ATP-binding cassette domain-containing protein, partial [Clostridiales bacterium]|nr:ATP-binding cassette domain-containing protein [Clostridiales bacterium]
GELYINGKQTRLNNVREAINNRIAYVTEDRKGDGLILTNEIRANTTLAKLTRAANFGISIDKDKEINLAQEYRERFGVKCSSIEQNVGNLSGGNQQKVLLAKWMFAEPDILILDEPTRGIDVGAKYDIYNIINDLVKSNKSVLIISSEMPEILGMCDRIYVMNEGSIVAELNRDEASQEIIMAKILQSSKEKKAV